MKTQEGISLITTHNKHIRLADRDAWDIVDVYSDDPLAQNDEDDKRIRRARKEAVGGQEKKLIG